ncbi:hypothetical protein PHLCEN_2v5979 [Hermanssonia centrifuga]|uniref:Fatty acid synthase meander beta sheet domain-containing protein n=1 Tax=Hermanssonia centrifuga TaxID=98765 RepID=A0A2R6P0U7_9APHY|nr:hypothetical protein PHLCEN_2v5979 [Hermanssonia centrifuga]
MGFLHNPTLAGLCLDWLRALFATPAIAQGAAHIDNPPRRLFAPRKKQHVVIDTEDGQLVSISLVGAAHSYGDHKLTSRPLRPSTMRPLASST